MSGSHEANESMRAWVVERPAPIDDGPLRMIVRARPEPLSGQVRVRVLACGVCRTDLHLAEGDLAVHRPRTTPGHEVVGIVDRLGPGASRFHVGDRIGLAWLASTCGTCRFCRSGRENLCMAPTFTGWDLDGGFAEYMVADERFAYRLPHTYGDEEVAPLLCAGIIGFRSLRRANLPDGGRLALYGFGGSAHLTAQVAMAEGASVYVMTRSDVDQELARHLGASFVGGSFDRPPVLMDAAILFAPVGTLVPEALAVVDRGATVVVAGIHLSDVPSLNYQDSLFQERTLTSVTANTRRDGEEFFEVCARIALRATTVSYGFDEVDTALSDLAHDRFSGAATVRIAES